MEQLKKILMDMDDSVDWERETALIDHHVLDSFGVISLVSELEDAFSITIEAREMVPENFHSMEAIYRMVTRLQGK